MTPDHAVVAIATDAAADLDRGRRLLVAVLDGPARTAPGHDDVLLTRPPSARFAVRLTEAVHRHNDSAATPLRLRLAMVHGGIPTALAVLGSDALRSAHAATTRPVTIALTDGYARARPITDTGRHRIARVPGVPEPVWLLDARVPDTEALFHALMALPSMRREETRRLVLDLLPPAITASVPDHSNGAMHVSGLLLTCLDHPDGLDALRRALHVVEGEGSTLMHRIDTLLRSE